MSVLVSDNVNISPTNRKYSSSSAKICINCGEELSSFDRKQICSGACKQERNVRVQLALRSYKNLKQNL